MDGLNDFVLEPFETIKVRLCGNQLFQMIPNQRADGRSLFRRPNPRLAIHLVWHRNCDILHSFTLSQGSLCRPL
jgi:hypothetical protein